MTTPLASLQKLLAAGKDSALLRFGLGNEHVKAGDAHAAIEHLRRAVELDPDYSAAWKLLGRALTESGQVADAIQAYDAGMAAAERRGDRQAMKEMMVFARRLRSRIAPSE
jgi:Flp pilus assembly protein TadD